MTYNSQVNLLLGRMLSLTRALLTRWTGDFVEIIYTDHLGDLRLEDPNSDVRFEDNYSESSADD